MTVQEDIVSAAASRSARTAGPISVCLLVGALGYGGAERQIVEMLRSFDRRRVRSFTCSFWCEKSWASNLPAAEEQLAIVKKQGRFDFTTVLRVARLLHRRKVDVVHAFLFDCEIIARLAAPLAGVPVVIASERNTDYSRPLLHRLALKATQPLFDVMVANSMAGKRFNMRTLGLAESRIEVVHNGVDAERFCPDRNAGLAFRKRLGIDPHSPLIGMVGSYKRQKGHDCFVRMAARVQESFPDARFVLVGEPVWDDFDATSRCQAEVKQLAASLKLADRCLFVGNQPDVQAVYNACDLTVLLSRREGTPNVVLESMACGVPVIVTNIADNALIVIDGKTGFVVPPEDSDAAAAFAGELLRNPVRRIAMGEAARERVCSQFSLRVAAAKLEDIYINCLKRKGAVSRHVLS